MFIDILSKNNFQQIKEISSIYKKNNGKVDLIEAIKKEMSGNISTALRAIGRYIFNQNIQINTVVNWMIDLKVTCAENKPFYFAKYLKKSMEGAGTKDADLIRLLTTRSEVYLCFMFIFLSVGCILFIFC